MNKNKMAVIFGVIALFLLALFSPWSTLINLGVAAGVVGLVWAILFFSKSGGRKQLGQLLAFLFGVVFLLAIFYGGYHGLLLLIEGSKMAKDAVLKSLGPASQTKSAGGAGTVRGNTHTVSLELMQGGMLKFPGQFQKGQKFQVEAITCEVHFRILGDNFTDWQRVEPEIINNDHALGLTMAGLVEIVNLGTEDPNTNEHFVQVELLPHETKWSQYLPVDKKVKAFLVREGDFLKFHRLDSPIQFRVFLEANAEETQFDRLKQNWRYTAFRSGVLQLKDACPKARWERLQARGKKNRVEITPL